MEKWRERSPPTDVARVRFLPGAICGFSLLLVLALLREFFSEFSGFPPSTKTNIFKFQFDQDRAPAWKPARPDVASSLNIVIDLFEKCIIEVSYVILQGVVCSGRVQGIGCEDIWRSPCLLPSHCRSYDRKGPKLSLKMPVSHVTNELNKLGVDEHQRPVSLEN